MTPPIRRGRPFARALVPTLLGLLLVACTGEDDDSSSQIRLLNATDDVVAVSLYTGSDLRVSGVGSDAVGAYASVASATYDLRARSDTDGTTVATLSSVLEADQHYTVVAWGDNGSIKLKLVTEEEDEPDSGEATVRALNATADAGSLDVYLTSAAAPLESATAVIGTVTSGNISGTAEVSAGTYRLRVTAAGDKNDVRLDVPSITLGNKDRVAIVLRQGAGGVLVHAVALAQQGAATPALNTQARVRLAAGVPGNGVVAASVGDTTLSKSLTSPGVGSYTLVPAGDQLLVVQANGATVTSATTRFTAGGDYTVLAYGTGTATVLADVNTLPTNTARAKMRLVNGVADGANLGMTLNAVAVASEVASGTSSTWANVLTNTDSNAIVEVTTPLSNTPLYTTEKTGGTSGLNITAGKLYTVFMLSGNATPKGILFQDR